MHVHSHTIYNSQQVKIAQMSINGWINKQMVISQTMEHYPAKKQNEVQIHATDTTWIFFKNIMSSERSQTQKITHCMLSCVCAQLCLTVCDPMDCSLPGFSDCGISWARIPKWEAILWIAILFSRGSSWCRDGTQVSCLAGRFFTIWATRESPEKPILLSKHIL